MGNAPSKDDASGPVTQQGQGNDDHDPDPSPSARRNSQQQEQHGAKRTNNTHSRNDHDHDSHRTATPAVGESDASARSVAKKRPANTTKPPTSPSCDTGYSSSSSSTTTDSVLSPTTSATSAMTTPKSIPRAAACDCFSESLGSQQDSLFAPNSASSNSSATSPPGQKEQQLYPIPEQEEKQEEKHANIQEKQLEQSSSSDDMVFQHERELAEEEQKSRERASKDAVAHLSQMSATGSSSASASRSAPGFGSGSGSGSGSGPSSSSSSSHSSSRRCSSTSSASSSHTRHLNKRQSVDISKIIERLVEAGLSKKTPKRFMLSQEEIMFVCSKARIIFMSQPMLLELAAPVKIAGDIHGQFQDLLRIFKMCGFPPNANYLFLGDYVDRGKQSLETIILLLCLKIKFPENFFMLRGNHESAGITRMYGFYDECKRRSSLRTWKMLVDVFNTLPVAATIAGRIFCVHGGLSPQLTDLNQIKRIQRPTDIPEEGLLADLLWSDPQVSQSTENYALSGSPTNSSLSVSGSPPHGVLLNGRRGHDWSENDRGVSYCFSKRVVNRFCERFSMDLVARGHMVVEQGYEFFGKRKLVTIFSAPNYCGEFDNWGAVMNVDRKLMCSFELLKPKKK